MAASRGVDSWNKHWRGRGNIPTRIKNTSSPYYSDSSSSRTSGNLPKDTEVTYIDILTQTHTKAAIQVGDNIFYTNIDNLVKPRSVSLISLKPQAFGLSGVEYSLTNYINAVKSSINSRQDILGDLQEYLLSLVDYADTNSQSFSGFDFSILPIADIKKDFGEVIGPIYCMRRGLLNRNLGITNASKILIPTSSTEPLLDYFIVNANGRVKVSAKAVGNSNTLKMRDLVPPILNDPSLYSKYSNDLEFNIMRDIHENSIVLGPIKACQLIGVVDQNAVNSVLYEPNQIPNPVLFSQLIQSDSRLMRQSTISTKQISFVCEKRIIDYSKQPTKSSKFTSIVRDVLNNEIFFVKFDISNGLPSFTVQATSGNLSINNLYFRTKNGYDSKSDKLGFKL